MSCECIDYIVECDFFQPNVSVSYCPGFDPLGTGETLWNDLKLDGEIDSKDAPLPKTSKYFNSLFIS